MIIIAMWLSPPLLLLRFGIAICLPFFEEEIEV